ncbi:MAG: hypothetical protein C5B49_04490 [Bdellovibrio sp.]|nr:MAG: hypothetical protein C5B49_04490 [Bdellovibrio sp.]
MCHAIPVKLIEKSGDIGVGERGGLRMEINLSLIPDARVGDELIVHVGIALAKLEGESSAGNSGSAGNSNEDSEVTGRLLQ